MFIDAGSAKRTDRVRAQGWRETLKSGTNHQGAKITVWSFQKILGFLHQFIPLNPSAMQMRGEVRSAESPLGL